MMCSILNNLRNSRTVDQCTGLNLIYHLSKMSIKIQVKHYLLSILKDQLCKFCNCLDISCSRFLHHYNRIHWGIQNILFFQKLLQQKQLLSQIQGKRVLKSLEYKFQNLYLQDNSQLYIKSNYQLIQLQHQELFIQLPSNWQLQEQQYMGSQVVQQQQL